VSEPEFLAGCTRCGDCIPACPVDAIVVAGDRYGPAAGTPVIEPMTSPCIMCDDTPCIAACEPGVLRREAGLRMGTASVDHGQCLAWQGTLCTVCSERCPVDGAIAVTGGRPAIDATACTGCGVCQHVCPAPYNAVLLLPDQTRLGAGTPPADDAGAPETPEGSFDWRRAYLGDRSLRPPARWPERPGPDEDRTD
jgi:ferredoxin-type protein NapG